MLELEAMKRKICRRKTEWWWAGFGRCMSIGKADNESRIHEFVIYVGLLSYRLIRQKLRMENYFDTSLGGEMILSDTLFGLSLCELHRALLAFLYWNLTQSALVGCRSRHHPPKFFHDRVLSVLWAPVYTQSCTSKQGQFFRKRSLTPQRPSHQTLSSRTKLQPIQFEASRIPR